MLFLLFVTLFIYNKTFIVLVSLNFLYIMFPYFKKIFIVYIGIDFEHDIHSSANYYITLLLEYLFRRS